MRKVGNIFARELDFKDVQFPVKIGDIHKIEKKKKNLCQHWCFWLWKQGKISKYVSKNTFKRHIDLSLTGEEGERHNVLIKDFNTFMYDHTLVQQKY